MTFRLRGPILRGALLTLAAVLFPTIGICESALPSLGLIANNGFCANGVWPGTRWPGGERTNGLTIWGSYCEAEDDSVGRIELQEFPAPPILDLYLAGYPGLPGRQLILKNVQSGEETELRPQTIPGERWHFNSLPVPSEWIGKPVQLLAKDSATGQFGWFGFSLPLLPPASVSMPAIDTSVPEGGFCADGVYNTTRWPDAGRPAGITTWGSYCKSGDAGTGWMTSQPVMAGPYLSLYIAGYPTYPGLRLAVENLQTRRQLLLQIPSSPMERWRLYHFRLPDEWASQSIRVVAGDQATRPFGWIAFSEPLREPLQSEASSAGKILGLVLGLAVLLLLPSATVCVAAAARGVRDVLDLTSLAFLALGVTGYATFWMYFCSRAAGVIFSYAGVLTCFAVLAYVWFVKDLRSNLPAVKQLIAPATLIVLASVFIVSLGMLHDGEGAPLSRAGYRFAPPGFAVDNAIPKMFADALYSGKIPKPLVGDWLSSDRPPLQTGNTLRTYAWTSGDRDLPYLALAVILQCSFLGALWTFLTICNVGRKPLALALATCLFSGFTFFNGFFTWPKLYPVSFLLIMVSYLLTDRFHEVRHRMNIGALVGLMAALALLCHGGSMFAILGLALCMLILRRLPSRRFLLGMAVGTALLYTPWSLYQKLYDPPGDRLLKWHVAGVVPPHPHEGFTKLLFGSYGKLKAHEIMQNKIGNFKTIAGDLPQFWEDAGLFGANLIGDHKSARDATGALIRLTMSSRWIPSIGFAVLGPVALLLTSLVRGRRGTEFIAARRMWLLTGLTLMFWALILFGPVATIPHQGTYLTEILAFAASCLAFWAIRPWIAIAVTTLQILWNAALFIWLTPAAPQTGVGAVVGPMNVFQAVTCLMSVAAIFFLLATFARQEGERPSVFRSVEAAADDGLGLQPALATSAYQMGSE